MDLFQRANAISGVRRPYVRVVAMSNWKMFCFSCALLMPLPTWMVQSLAPKCNATGGQRRKLAGKTTSNFKFPSDDAASACCVVVPTILAVRRLIVCSVSLCSPVVEVVVAPVSCSSALRDLKSWSSAPLPPPPPTDLAPVLQKEWSESINYHLTVINFIILLLFYSVANATNRLRKSEREAGGGGGRSMEMADRFLCKSAGRESKWSAMSGTARLRQFSFAPASGRKGERSFFPQWIRTVQLGVRVFG